MPTKIKTPDLESARAFEAQQASWQTTPKRHPNEPLGMPKGSVRALITLFAIAGFAAAIAYSMYSSIAIPESLSSIVITIIAFYFGTRSAGKEVDGNEIEVAGSFSGEADRISGSKNLAKH